MVTRRPASPLGMRFVSEDGVARHCDIDCPEDPVHKLGLGELGGALNTSPFPLGAVILGFRVDSSLITLLWGGGGDGGTSCSRGRSRYRSG